MSSVLKPFDSRLDLCVGIIDPIFESNIIELGGRWSLRDETGHAVGQFLNVTQDFLEFRAR